MHSVAWADSLFETRETSAYALHGVGRTAETNHDPSIDVCKRSRCDIQDPNRIIHAEDVLSFSRFAEYCPSVSLTG